MSHAARTQATALTLAVAVTFGMLSSMNLLATQAHDEDTGATRWESPAQVIVVTGKRDARS